MKINSVNAMRYENHFKSEKEMNRQDEVILNGNYEDKVDDFKHSVKKANNSVHVLTLALGAATAFATWKKGVEWCAKGRAVAVSIGGLIAKNAVKLVDNLKKTSPEQTSETLEKISKNVTRYAMDLRENNPKVKEHLVNMIDGVFSYTKDGEVVKKGEQFIETLNKNNVWLNKTNLFDNVVAAGVAAYATQHTCDITENGLDGKDIENSFVKNFGKEALGYVKNNLNSTSQSEDILKNKLFLELMDIIKN